MIGRRNEVDLTIGSLHVCGQAPNLTLHVHVDGGGSSEVHSKLNALLAQGKQLMALTQETRDLLTAIDTETTRIADEMANIVSEAEDEGEIAGLLQPHLDRLRGIAHNPAQPIPPVE